MKSRIRVNTLFFLLCIVGLTESVSAQPFVYYTKSSSWQDDTAFTDVYRFNLATQTNEKLAGNVGKVINIFTNSDQTRFFVLNATGLDVYTAGSGEMGRTILSLDDSTAVVDVTDAPLNGKIFVSLSTDEGYSQTIVLDRVTYDSVGCIDQFMSFHKPLLSKDGRFFFRLIPDTTGIFFDMFDGNDGTLYRPRIQCGMEGEFKFETGISDGRGGKAIVVAESIVTTSPKWKDYYVCDPESGSIIVKFFSAWRSEARLSADGRFSIVEQVKFDKSRASAEYRPGNIWVFDNASGALIARLSPPPEGKILVFDNHPSMMYYYLPEEDRSINVDLSKLVSATKLVPSSANAGSSGFTMVVHGRGFSDASVIHWNAAPRATSYLADSVLQASILASDLANPGVAEVTVVSGAFDTSAALKFLTNPQLVSGISVKLIGSDGSLISSGALQYYDSSWKDAINNSDGTFRVNTTLSTVSLRMTYEGGSQTKTNVPVGPDTVVFQTVKAQVRLQDSQGALIDTGNVQYYAGTWRTFGTTTNGVAAKELLPGSYSFRMTYAHGSNDKQQDIGADPVVIFQTVPATVKLQNSQGTPLDQGTVQYYAGAWRSLGTTGGGVVTKELLPNNYPFRMTYAFGSNDKQQNIGSNPTVVFTTTNATVELRNSQGALIDQGTVQYYAGAWRSFGSTSGGTVSKELLPANYSFRMTSEYVPVDKAQNISTNSIVGFSTVLCTVRVRNTQNQPVDNAIVSYYSGGWRQLGPTVNGEITKELLPGNLTFGISYGGTTQDKVQNLAVGMVVEFVVQ